MKQDIKKWNTKGIRKGMALIGISLIVGSAIESIYREGNENVLSNGVVAEIQTGDWWRIAVGTGVGFLVFLIAHYHPRGK